MQPKPLTHSSVEDVKKAVLAHLELIDRLAAKKYLDTSLAGEASMYVLEKLEQDNWQRVRKFEDKAKFSTFLAVLTRRLLEDFSRKKFGRARPPAWVKRLGGLWLEVFRRLCMERLSLPDTVTTLRSEIPARSSGEIEEVAHTILLKISTCGEQRGRETLIENEDFDHPNHLEDHCKASIEDVLQERDERLLLDAISREFLTENDEVTSLHAGIKRLQQIGITLNHEERLMLRLRFSEGMTFAATGQLLGMSEEQTRRKVKALLTMLRDKFTLAGMDDILQDILS